MSSIGFVQNMLHMYDTREYVVEFSRDSGNEQIRAIFEGSRYTRIVLESGEQNIIRSILAYKPQEQPDTILCCDILEHTRYGEAVCKYAYNTLTDNGILVILCATNPTLPYSFADGSALISNDDWYKNVHPAILRYWLKPFAKKKIITCTETHRLIAMASKIR